MRGNLNIQKYFQAPECTETVQSSLRKTRENF